jgi:hypothetical protein
MNLKRQGAKRHEPHIGSTHALKNERFDRRRFLRGGSVAAAAGAGAVLLRPSAAGATTGAMQLGLENDTGAASTGLTSSNGTDTLHVTNSANAIALEVRSGGAGVIATGFSGGGVVGLTRGAGPGLSGQADVGTGPAVKAEIDNAAATAATIQAAQSGTGDGVLSQIDNTTSSGRSLLATTNGLGQAVLAKIVNSANKSAAIRGQTTGLGSGVEGVSTLGIGGRFSGRTAHIELVPSKASSHPTEGEAGQLFVDSSSRLWYCKGGKSWHQLA